MSTTQPGTSQGDITLQRYGVSLPWTKIKGEKNGPHLLLVSGIHGVEYQAIAAARQLAKTLHSDELQGEVTIIHLANPAGFYERREYINPADGVNLGTSFPGNNISGVSAAIAYEISAILNTCDFVIDLHSGDDHEELTPFTVVSSQNSATYAQSMAAAKAVGFPYIVTLPNPELLVGSASIIGKPGLMLEFGGCGIWNEGQAKEYAEKICNVLKFLKLLPGQAALAETTYLPGYHSVKSSHDACWIPFLTAGSQVLVGDLIGRTEDIFGNILQEFCAEESGVLLYILKALAVKKNGSLFAIGY